MTQRELFTRLQEVVAMVEIEDSNELIAGLEERIAQLDRKAQNKSTKPTKAQIEGKVIYDNIVSMMSADDFKPMTNADITKAYNEQFGTEYSPQKIQAQITKGVKNDTIVRTSEKGKAHFSLAQ